MSTQEHRPGVQQASLVKRQLQLKAAPESEQALADFISEADQLQGMDSLSYAPETNQLELQYDASHLNLAQIEQLLSRFHINLQDNWWQHLKQGYYQFVDDNIRDNALHQPSCCHPPTGENRKH